MKIPNQILLKLYNWQIMFHQKILLLFV